MKLHIPDQGQPVDRRKLRYAYYMFLAYDEEYQTVLFGFPETTFESDPNDPPWPCCDSRGWHCHPEAGCEWEGVV
ncbi:hypothetical protein [Streptomyces sp. NPDC049585]|uniref:hypothetical protein n=1 Tax=Streptomyces sp. NPDC049585 TaxID=3155154 RepID=UPI003416E905